MMILLPKGIPAERGSCPSLYDPLSNKESSGKMVLEFERGWGE
jgi:hypothetical protein